MTRWSRWVLVLSLCGAVLADEPPAPSGAQFLRSVIRRMEGKPEEDPPVQELAKPVADLKAALERVSESMAANGMDLGQADPTAQLPISGPGSFDQASDVSGDPGPPYVLAPHMQTLDVAASGYPPSAPAPIQAPPLSKDELSAVYQAVVDKGLLLDLASIKGGYLPGAPGQGGAADQLSQASGQPGPNQAGQAGYYYYFFPIKGLTDQKSQQLSQHPQAVQHNGIPEGDPGQGMGMEQAAVMSVMNALGADMNNVMGGGESQKSVEPLFMAMAGFIGMALMFVLSVLFLPKWGTLRSRGVTALKHAPDELASLTKLVVQSIEGKDCSERIACEVGRAVRTMRLGNKPLRILEIILPPNLSKQIGHIRKAARKAEKCNFIPCKYPASFSHPFKPFLPNKLIPNKLPPPLSTRPPVITRAASSMAPTSTSTQQIHTTPRSKPLPHTKQPNLTKQLPQQKPLRIKLFSPGNNSKNGNSNFNGPQPNRNNSKQWQNQQSKRVAARSTTTAHPLS